MRNSLQCQLPRLPHPHPTFWPLEISRLSHVRAPWLNEMCAVCMLHMEKDEEPSLSWCVKHPRRQPTANAKTCEIHASLVGMGCRCGTCGRSLHRDCLELWHKHRRKALQVLPCPWCRSPWVDGSVEAGWIAAHGTRPLFAWQPGFVSVRKARSALACLRYCKCGARRIPWRVFGWSSG
jgi:hypothetical protein